MITALLERREKNETFAHSRLRLRSFKQKNNSMNEREYWTRNASIEHVIKCSDWIVAACKRVTKHSQCMIAWYWTQSLQKAGSVLPRGRTSRVFDTLRKLLLCAALYMVLVANQSGMKETERVDWAQIALYCVCSVGISQKCKLLNLF